MLIAGPGGIEMRLGDAWNGFTWRGTFRTIGQAIEELARQAKEQYPVSAFALGGGEFDRRLEKERRRRSVDVD